MLPYDNNPYLNPANSANVASGNLSGNVTNFLESKTGMFSNIRDLWDLGKNTVEDYKKSIGSEDFLRTLAFKGNSQALDLLASYMLSEQSAQTARNWTAQREDTSYQRMAEDLRKAGLNPWILASGGSPIGSASQGTSYQGSKFTSAEMNRQKLDTTERGQNLGIVSDVINFIGRIIGQMIGTVGNVASTLIGSS